MIFMVRSYPVLKLNGTPEERGRTYGSKYGKMIRRSISNYGEMFEAFSNISWENAKKRAKIYLPSVEKYAPEILEEIDGIASGANLGFDDIFTLNSRSEIVLDQNTLDGCTAFGITPRISKDSKTYICQNWDWIRRQHDNLVVLDIEQSPLPSILMIAEAGIISGKGMNSKGIGVCFNALSTGKAEKGVPVHFLLRKILDSPSLGDTVESVAKAQRASSGNFLVGSDEGEIINIESSPTDFGVLYAEKGFLAHTNHFIAMNMIFKNTDNGKAILPDTFHRLGRINSLIEENLPELDTNKFKEFLSDHRSLPDAICRHEDPHDPEGKQLASVYSVIMDLKGKALFISEQNPCKGSFETYTFQNRI
jgi:isopenicillin-N N-acyltransferase-like protein